MDVSKDLDLSKYLQLMVHKEASDLFFSAGAPVSIKIEGVTRHLNPEHKLTPGEVYDLAYSIMDDQQTVAFERDWEMNLAVAMSHLGRFRVNIYRQRGAVAMVIRYLRHEIPSIEALNLPAILNDLVMEPRGLVLLVGATGTGKSTTLASMIEHRSASTTGHILTIEEPIEYLHQHRESIVDQRELGMDTHSYADALKNAMREAPDVILIGEIRDQETMQHAIAYSETGHLCLSTLHAANSDQAFDRILSFYPETAYKKLMMDLSMNLRAVVSQRLVIGKDGKRLPAVEILLNTPYVSDIIQKGELERLKEAMKEGREVGMQTMDQSLFDLYKAGKIEYDEAIKHADSKNDLRLRVRLSEPGGIDQVPEDLTYDTDEGHLRR